MIQKPEQSFMPGKERYRKRNNGVVENWSAEKRLESSLWAVFIIPAKASTPNSSLLQHSNIPRGYCPSGVCSKVV